MEQTTPTKETLENASQTRIVGCATLGHAVSMLDAETANRLKEAIRNGDVEQVQAESLENSASKAEKNTRRPVGPR